MANAQLPLPSFGDPPVTETVLGVEFAALERWGIPYFGLFWDKVRAEYPNFEIHPALASEDNRGITDLLQAVMAETLPVPTVRCWYKHESDSRLLQVQHDRFVLNWRKTEGKPDYSRYKATRPMFEREWVRFTDFLTQEKIGTPQPLRCEVSYVNHLASGKEWTSLSDLARVFPFWSGGTASGKLLEPNAFSINFGVPLADDKGQLTVMVQPAVRRSDGKKVLQFTLSAKGRPASGGLDDVLAWLDVGHETVVRSFCELTSPEMHKLWKRKE